MARLAGCFLSKFNTQVFAQGLGCTAWSGQSQAGISFVKQTIQGSATSVHFFSQGRF